MPHYFHMTRVSGNKKTGPIPVTTSSMDTCPLSCILHPDNKGGCYAYHGHIRLHWDKVSNKERGYGWWALMDKIRALPRKTFWRHNQAGDLPPSSHNPNEIDCDRVVDITTANLGKRGFTYTHYDVDNKANMWAIKYANKNGFTINVSADNKYEAAQIVNQCDVPVVCLLETNAPNLQVVDGVKIVACPVETGKVENCTKCELCYDAKRKYVIGFRAHGSSKKKVNIIAKG